MKFLVILGLFLMQQPVLGRTGLSLNSRTYFQSGNLFSLRKQEPGLHRHRLHSFLTELNSKPQLIRGQQSEVQRLYGLWEIHPFNQMLKINKIASTVASAHELADALYEDSQGITIADHFEELKTVAAQLNSVDWTKNLPSDFSEKLINADLNRFDLLIKIIQAVDSANSTEDFADKLYWDIIKESLWMPVYREEYPVLGLGGIVKVGTRYPEEN